MVLNPPGAAQTPKTTDFQPNPKPPSPFSKVLGPTSAPKPLRAMGGQYGSGTTEASALFGTPRDPRPRPAGAPAIRPPIGAIGHYRTLQTGSFGRKQAQDLILQSQMVSSLFRFGFALVANPVHNDSEAIRNQNLEKLDTKSDRKIKSQINLRPENQVPELWEVR